MNDVIIRAPSFLSTINRTTFFGAAYSENSKRSFGADWSNFTSWCASQGVAPLPALPQTVVDYLLRENEAGRAVATIHHRAATIARAHRLSNLPSPCDEEIVRLALRSISRQRGTNQKQAPALLGRHADRIVAHVAGPDARLKDLRDVALVLVGRDLLARANELVALTVEAVAFDAADGTALVNVRRFKTSTRTKPCMLGAESTAALVRWLDAGGIKDGPIFRSLTRGGNLRQNGISERDVSRILKSLGARARLSPDFSSHSLRVGMAQDLVAANIDSASIMQAGGWRTPQMLARYTEDLTAKRGAIAQYHARRK